MISQQEIFIKLKRAEEKALTLHSIHTDRDLLFIHRALTEAYDLLRQLERGENNEYV